MRLNEEYKRIEELRQKLLKAAVCKNLTDGEVLEASQKLDAEIVYYYDMLRKNRAKFK